MQFQSLKFFILLFSFFLDFKLVAQNIKVDTILHSNKIWKIETKKNDIKLGPSKTYLTYTDKPIIDLYQFYLNNQLIGFELKFFEGNISSITNFRNNVAIFSKSYFLGSLINEKIFPSTKTVINYTKFQKIESIEYPELKEKVTFYPNMSVKSIILSDSSKKLLTRKYYEFSERGILKVEGVYADSFIQINDTIVTFDPETYEEIWQVIIQDEPLKNGEWVYYNGKGIIQERKKFNYYTEKKGKLIKN